MNKFVSDMWPYLDKVLQIPNIPFSRVLSRILFFLLNLIGIT